MEMTHGCIFPEGKVIIKVKNIQNIQVTHKWLFVYLKGISSSAIDSISLQTENYPLSEFPFRCSDWWSYVSNISKQPSSKDTKGSIIQLHIFYSIDKFTMFKNESKKMVESWNIISSWQCSLKECLLLLDFTF